MEDIRLKETENLDKMDDKIFQDEVQRTRQTETERPQNKIEDQIKVCPSFFFILPSQKKTRQLFSLTEKLS